MKIEIVDDHDEQHDHDDESREDLFIKDAEITGETKTLDLKPARKLTDFEKFYNSLPEEESATFKITRQPDRNLAGKFRLPCNTQIYTGTIYWNAGDTEPDELYNEIARTYGGGRYSIQVRQGEGFSKSWTVNIDDPAQPSEKELTLRKEAESTAAEAAPAQQPQPKSESDSFDNFVNQIRKVREVESLFRTDQPQPVIVQQQQSEPPQLTDEAIRFKVIEKSLDDPNLRERALNAMLNIPQNEAGAEPEENLIVTGIKYIFNNPTESKTVLDLILESAAGAIGKVFTQPQPPPAQPAIYQPSVMPAQNFDLQQFKRPQNAPAQAPIIETQPQAQPAPAIAPIIAAPAAEIPFVSFED